MREDNFEVVRIGDTFLEATEFLGDGAASVGAASTAAVALSSFRGSGALCDFKRDIE